MSEDNITVKVSGTAVYKAVKNYLDNSENLKAAVHAIADKHLEHMVKGRIESLLSGIETSVRHKVKTELDVIVKKEVEARVAEYISKGIQRMFESSK